MRCLKKTISLLLAAIIAVSSAIIFFSSAGSEAKAAGNKYEYISFGVREEYSIKYTKEVQNGNFFIKFRKNKIQVKNGKSGTYKTTEIKTQPYFGFAGNGKFLYYMEKTNNAILLKRYNYKTAKIEKVKKLPTSDSKYSDEMNMEDCKILGTCGDYIFFSSFNDFGGHGDAVLYSFNVKNKKIKKAGIKGFGFEQTNGEYLVVEDTSRVYSTPTSYSLYKFVKNGTVKKIKQVAKNTVFVCLNNNSLYWVGLSKKPSSKNVLYTMNIDGTDKKSLYTATKKFPIQGVCAVDDSGIYMDDYSGVGNTNYYKYVFKTKKMTTSEYMK